MSLLVGYKAPEFKGNALIGGDSAMLNHDNAFKQISTADYENKWVVFFFYTLDFSGVCPTELVEFGKHYEEFKQLDCEVIACSTDSHFSHLAFRQQHPQLKNIPFMMLSDFTRENARKYEVLKEETGWAVRGLYIIDNNGILKYSVIHPESVARSCKETLRVLKALQVGKPIPCDWEAGQATL